jgi:hypothetical protein
MKKIALSAAGLMLLAPGAMAGEFFSGTRSDSNRYESTRTATGSESIKAIRNFDNKIEGSSHKQFGSVTASAENARLGGRRYGFVEGEAEIDGQLQGVGSLGWGTADLAAFGQLGVEVDGMAGYGHERYLDGSLSASYEVGGMRSKFKLSEDGKSVFSSTSDFSEVSNTDGTGSTSGSVFSFN